MELLPLTRANSHYLLPSQHQVGYSNGGFMAHRMACERGDMLRSIISLAGATHYDFNDCPNTGYPNVLQIHGTSDSVIFYDGGAILGDNYPAASQTVFSWANRSGCDLTYTEINQRLIYIRMLQHQYHLLNHL